MVISLKKAFWPAVIVLSLGIIVVLSFTFIPQEAKNKYVMGGHIYDEKINTDQVQQTVNPATDISDERFRRPSRQPELQNPYTFKKFEKDIPGFPLINDKFDSPEKAAKAFFGILRDAANMSDYKGGCGTIGNAMGPYPYAYELLTEKAQKSMSLKQFTDSFEGKGAITLLKLYPAYAPAGTPPDTKYLMFEIEAITGPSQKDPRAFADDGSYFAYYYGIITLKNDPKTGWKIESIDYLPEDFLCAPMHGWAYYADTMVGVIYKDWYQLIDKIDRIEMQGDRVYVYASGKGKEYRFDFVRLTNGHDIMLHENIKQNGKWVETQILKDKDNFAKFTIRNDKLYEKS